MKTNSLLERLLGKLKAYRASRHKIKSKKNYKEEK